MVSENIINKKVKKTERKIKNTNDQNGPIIEFYEFEEEEEDDEEEEQILKELQFFFLKASYTESKNRKDYKEEDIIKFMSYFEGLQSKGHFKKIDRFHIDLYNSFKYQQNEF